MQGPTQSKPLAIIAPALEDFSIPIGQRNCRCVAGRACARYPADVVCYFCADTCCNRLAASKRPDNLPSLVDGRELNRYEPIAGITRIKMPIDIVPFCAGCEVGNNTLLTFRGDRHSGHKPGNRGSKESNPDQPEHRLDSYLSPRLLSENKSMKT